jgi:futalosine hydrolase
MEGFVVLRAAALAGVPAVEVRAVSNAVAEVDRSRWHVADALEALRAAVPPLLQELAGA